MPLAYIYIRSEFYHGASRVQRAINRAYGAGPIGENTCGSGYNSISTYTVVQKHTSAARKRLSSSRLKTPRQARNQGTKSFCVSGHVNNPCVVKEMSIPLKDLVEKHCDGVIGGWDHPLGIVPGGSSVPILPRKLCEEVFRMNLDSLKDTRLSHVSPSSTNTSPAVNAHPAAKANLDAKRDGPHGRRPHSPRQDLHAPRIDEAGRRKDDLRVGDAAVWPIQGLMRHFCPEVERRIAEYRAANGLVRFGGKLKSDTDFSLAVPDNLGANLIDGPRARVQRDTWGGVLSFVEEDCMMNEGEDVGKLMQ
ncbi:NADH dehydrogenase [ubiquinone] flavoprotein 1, mitochondrial [Ceratobasidium sp. UAMH 11750]|nr:NADH dehydrogenase [ubiquinone] flavoprotein 1, mitochondrial [Ceratobasidium sp. UAMH 11750]